MSAVHSRALSLYAGVRLNPVPIAASTPISGVSLGGATLGAVSATAASGLSTAQLAQSTSNTANNTANTAINGLSNKLEAGTSYVLSGNVILGSAGHGLYTTGFSGGNGVAFTDNGLAVKKSGATTFVIDGYGNVTMAGILDCGNGAVIRTPNLAGSGSADLVKLQISNGNQFGALRYYADTFGTGGYYPGMGWEYNFSGPSCTLMGIIDTNSGQSSRLVLSANGTLWHATLLNGVIQFAANLAKCNNVNQAGPDADKLDGHHAADFSLTSHNHAGVYADFGHTHSG